MTTLLAELSNTGTSILTSLIRNSHDLEQENSVLEEWVSGAREIFA
jgi:hypothetical protein